MAAYFARRLVNGVVTLFLVSLLLYSFLICAPGSVNDQLQEIMYPPPGSPHGVIDVKRVNMVMREFGLDKPWPLNYVAWFFSPDRKGILTGDFGVSLDSAQDQPVADVFGPNLGMFILLLPLTLLAAMAFALVQHRHRPRIIDMPFSPLSSKLLPEYMQEMWVLSNL